MRRQSSPEMRTLAANLLAHRKARGLTRKDVYEGTGITDGVLLQYETIPGQDVYLLPILKLARFYSTTIEDLLSDEDKNIPPMIRKYQDNKRKSPRK